jgi:transcriptional regulator with XRE-family HTH domain
MATFAGRLRELRGKAGMTQQQLADASGLPVGSLRNYEQGHREPYWQVVFRLAKGLGVACEAFADCVGDPPAEPGPPRRGRKKGK